MLHTNEIRSTVNTTIDTQAIQLTDSISYPTEQKQFITIDSPINNKLKDCKSSIEKFIKKTRFHIFGLLLSLKI